MNSHAMKRPQSHHESNHSRKTTWGAASDLHPLRWGRSSSAFVVSLWKEVTKALRAMPSPGLIAALLVLMVLPLPSLANEGPGSSTKAQAGATDQTAEPEKWSEDYLTAAQWNCG